MEESFHQARVEKQASDQAAEKRRGQLEGIASARSDPGVEVASQAPRQARGVSGPSQVAFSEHALDQLARRGRSERRIAEIVLVGHARRRRNPGSAEWLIKGHGLEVVYDWPDRGDPMTAYVVSVWPG